MKYTARIMYLAALIILLGGCCNGKKDEINYAEDPSTTITRLLSAMKEDLAGIKDYATSKGLTLDEIALTVNAASSIEASGSIKILILKVGGAESRTYTNEYTVFLTDVDSTTPTSLDGAVSNFAAALKNIIDNRPTVADMETSKIIGSLKFVLKQETEGSANFEILPLTVDFGGGVTDSYTNTLKLTFKVN